MKKQTEKMNRSEAGRSYVNLDAMAKKELSNPVFLALIAKMTIGECRNMKLDDIMQCFKGNPFVMQVPLARDTAGKVLFGPAAVPSANTESSSEYEGKVVFDVIQEIEIPSTKKTEAIQVIMNLEMQNNRYSYRRTIFRAILYMARVLASQPGNTFKSPEYENLRKVYSVWIMMPEKGHIQNAVSRLYIKVDPIPLEGFGLGKMRIHHQDYDVMEGFLIQLGEVLPVLEKQTLQKVEDGGQLNWEKMIGLLDVLFAIPMEKAEQDAYVKDTLGLELEQEVQDMIGEGRLKTSWAIKAREEGRQEGRIEGIEKGRQEGRIEGIEEGQTRQNLKNAQIAAKNGFDHNRSAEEVANLIRSFGIERQDVQKILMEAGYKINDPD